MRVSTVTAALRTAPQLHGGGRTGAGCRGVQPVSRLNREIVTEWDESLYAISAAETARHGHWIGITFDDALDYYNTKPPLNVWLIAVSFKAFGINLISLRIASAVAAWLTVLVLMLWAKRAFGAATAILAGLVLSTTHGFIYVHSGRSANTDALFTLFTLLTVVILWVAEHRAWLLVWLGPILAAVFLLRGMAVLMPLTMVSPSSPSVAAACARDGRRCSLRPSSSSRRSAPGPSPGIRWISGSSSGGCFITTS